ncbi:hypothetical protein NDU88_003872 [Pleurodeles waltl]|uniref:Uncharacterized protein n=1 Tax=Pleurodeles waltl TaxID=8319 RepID=A0AAV7T7G3_PLEWA|nr:hypothetical protein NDU88_003872 [Pleurodeles waltl]
MSEYGDIQGDEDPLAQLPWDDEFSEAVDASIYSAVEEVMAHMEKRSVQQFARECNKQAQIATTAVPAPTSPASPKMTSQS